MNLKKAREVITSILPIFITLLAAFFADSLNIKASFIPEDKTYEVSLTIYSILWTALFRGISQIANIIINMKSFVKIQFSEGKPKFKEQDLIECDFESDIANLYFKVQLEGDPKKFSDKTLRIVLPTEVEAHKIDNEKKKYSSNCHISQDKKSVFIKLKDLYNTDKNERIKDSKILGFKVVKNYEEINSHLEISIINNKKKKIKMIANELLFTK